MGRKGKQQKSLWEVERPCQSHRAPRERPFPDIRMFFRKGQAAWRGKQRDDARKSLAFSLTELDQECCFSVPITPLRGLHDADTKYPSTEAMWNMVKSACALHALFLFVLILGGREQSRGRYNSVLKSQLYL